jgi:hypothetical protein
VGFLPFMEINFNARLLPPEPEKVLEDAAEEDEDKLDGDDDADADVAVPAADEDEDEDEGSRVNFETTAAAAVEPPEEARRWIFLALRELSEFL